MSIFLVRHGETALNVARMLQPADTPLSPRGQQQAAALARRLRELGVAEVLSSDLPRALQTADAIAQETGAAVHASALLQERNFGAWRGRRYDELGFDPLSAVAAPPGGESMQAFRARVALAFEHVVRQRARLDGNLAVVTHGLVLRALIGERLPWPGGQPVALRVGNTALTICAHQPPHAIALLDCTRHLDDAAPHDDHSLSGG